MGKAGPKLTNAERRRRQHAVAELYEAGYPSVAIAAALRIGNSTIQDDLRAMGHKEDRRRRRKHEITQGPAPVLDWRDPDSAWSLQRFPKEAPYKRSPILFDTLHWVEGFNSGDYPNRLAWHLYEATKSGDKEWVRYVERLVGQALGQFQILDRVLHDAEYREQVRRGTSPELRTRPEDTPRMEVA